jgi:hypothetical protein
MYPNVVARVTESIRQIGGVVDRDPSTDLLTVNNEFTASLVLARCRQTEAGLFRWLIRVDAGLKPDITVAVRMDAENRDPIDYYLLPSLDLTFEKLLLAEDNPVSLDTYRFDTLDFFFGMAQRTRIPEAA